MHILGGLGFSKAALFTELLVDLTTRGELEDEVDLLVVVEESVELADVLVAEVALNFDLSAELQLYIVLQDLFLVEDLQSHYELGVLLSGEVDMTKLASAHRLPNFEVVDRPLLGVELVDFLDRRRGQERGTYRLL